MVQLPYGVYHDDTADFLTTTERLLEDGEFKLHSKKTFLVPVAFTLPFLLRVPAMQAIPAVQHLLGLTLVLLVGVLCRLWFERWKLFLIPLTVLTAVNPFLLWYEHTLMAESIFVFCTVVVAVAGTLYARAQTHGRFVFLCIALVLEAGARPEGKLLFGFGMLLVALLHFRSPWRAWPRLAIMAVLAVGAHFATKTSQAGLLLYTSVARLTPADLSVAPGFDPHIAPVREDLQNRWDEYPAFPRVRDRRAVSDAVQSYLNATASGQKVGKSNVDSFSMKLAIETCLRNAPYMPVLAFHKFRSVANLSPSGTFDESWLQREQKKAFLEKLDRTLSLSEGLTGTRLATEADVDRFISNHYPEVPWFNAFSERWLSAVNHFRLPDVTYPVVSTWEPFIYRGVPFYFMLAGVGVAAVCLMRGALQPLHIAWGLTLAGFFFVIMLTANVRARFRIVFEPFWFIYIGLLLDVAWSAINARWRSGVSGNSSGE